MLFWTRFIVIIFVHVEEEKHICCNEKFVTSQLAKKVLKHSLLTAPGKKAISGITATTYYLCMVKTFLWRNGDFV